MTLSNNYTTCSKCKEESSILHRVNKTGESFLGECNNCISFKVDSEVDKLTKIIAGES